MIMRDKYSMVLSFVPFRSLTLEADRLKRLEDDLRKREVALSNVEVHVDQQVQMKLNK